MLALIAFILLMTSFILPWYGIHEKREYEYSDGDTEINEYGSGFTLSFFISPAGYGGATLYGGTATSGIFMLASLLLIAGLIFIGLFLLSILFKFGGKINQTNTLRTLGVLAMIFCILAPMIFMIGLPGALKSDAEKSAKNSGSQYEEPDHDDPTKSFFGSYEDVDEDSFSKQTDTTSWGGDIGWVFAFVSFVFLLISFIMVRSQRETVPVPQPYPEAPVSQMPAQPPLPGQVPTQPPLPGQVPTPPVQPHPRRVPPTQVTCPGCKNVIKINATSYPAPVKCPVCGTKGFIE